MDISDMYASGSCTTYGRIWYGHTLWCHTLINESIQILYWEEISCISFQEATIEEARNYKRRNNRLKHAHNLKEKPQSVSILVSQSYVIFSLQLLYKE